MSQETTHQAVTAERKLAWGRALVYGLGLSGQAAARLLLARDIAVLGVDRRQHEDLDLAGLTDDPRFELLAGEDLSTPPTGVDGVVVSPGVPWDQPALVAARAAGVPVIPEVELAFLFLQGPVVGITGSNGKSTTTALTGALLEAAGFSVEVCGNIGVPLSARVDGPPGRVFVVELSSFQLQGIDTFRPRAAALLNLSPDHLDRHPDLAAYLAAKSTLFAEQEEDDIAVLNADDPLVAAVGARARRRFFSRRKQVEDGCYLDGGTVVEAQPGAPSVALFESGDLGISGVHNLENAMAAALLARSAGVAAEQLPAALREFRGLPHRMETVGEAGGVTWINDSKATNVGAALKSLEGFGPASVHLILGGRGKGAKFEDLLEAADKIRRAYLIGETASELSRLFESKLPTETTGDLARAVEAASSQVQPGETVLLAPACASFDQYTNFAARGEHFRALVQAEIESEGDDG